MDESSSSRARESRPRRRVIDDPQTAHFITFGCDRRRQLLNQDRCQRIVIHFFEERRRQWLEQETGHRRTPDRQQQAARQTELTTKRSRD